MDQVGEQIGCTYSRKRCRRSDQLLEQSGRATWDEAFTSAHRSPLGKQADVDAMDASLLKALS